MAIAVRRATAADAEPVSALNADVQALHAAAMPQRFKSPGANTFQQSAAAALIARSGNLVFIAEADGEAVGYAYAEVVRRSETAFHHAYDSVYLHHISVTLSHRRLGAGAALLEAVRSAGRELGIDLLTADVWSFNEDARAFFRRHGLAPYIERLWNR